MKIQEIKKDAEIPSKAQSLSPSRKNSHSEPILDTWIFEGRSYKAPYYEMPQPLHAAFKEPKVLDRSEPPYKYDQKQFEVFFEENERADGTSEEAGVVCVKNYADIAGITHDDGLSYIIELCNSENGGFPVARDEFLRAVHAAKLVLRNYTRSEEK